MVVASMFANPGTLGEQLVSMFAKSSMPGEYRSLLFAT
jgi:hypothetical protein